jgi:hypothetical protein
MAFSVKSAVRGCVILVLLTFLTELADANRNASFQREDWTW